MKSGDELALRLGQIERRAIHARHRAGDVDPEHHERERVVEQIPVREPAGLFFGDRDEIHRAGQHHGHHDAHPEGHFVAHHLRRLPHRPEERPLRRRGVARENHAEHLEPEHGHHEKHAHIEPLAHKIKRERQGDKGRERRTEADIRRDPKQQTVGPLGHQIFLGKQLDAVGQRLEPAEPATRPRGPETVLNPGGNLSLRPNEDERAAGDHVQNQKRGHSSHDGPREPGRQAD